VKLWAADCERCIDTAKHFAAGFFGLNYEKHGRAVLEVVSEDPDKGGDTLTPGYVSTVRVSQLYPI